MSLDRQEMAVEAANGSNFIRRKAASRTQSKRSATAAKAAPSLTGAAPRPKSLTDQAYGSLKEKILSLHFLPGQYLNELGLCKALGFGRTPIHQALQRLQQEGLIAVVPRKGVLVEPDSIAKILEVLDARGVIEPELSRAAASRVSAEDMESLRKILDRDAESHGGGVIEAFVERDREFHALIAEYSGNRILSDFAKTLHARSARYWQLHMWQTFNPVATARQHREILVAIAARDCDAAATAMRDHISDLRARLLHLQEVAPKRLLSPT